MATPVNLNGATYSVPVVGEPRGTWGSALSNYLIAISTGTLQRNGGNQALAADLNTGTKGFVVPYIKSSGTNIANSGQVRLANLEGVVWRNAANNSDLSLVVDALDRLTFNGSVLAASSDLTALEARVTTAEADIDAAQLDIDTHEARVDNPHAVTKAQVGLSNTDNTSDANKPVSTAQAAADAAVQAFAIQRANHTGSQAFSTISGTVPITQGGTGQTTKSPAFDALSPNTTKGDITVRNATVNTRLPVGADTFILTADSSTAEGMKWATPAAGFTNPMSVVGDLIYGGTSGVGTRLPPNTTTVRQVLTQTGTGGGGQAPVWSDDLAAATVYGRVKGGTLPSQTSGSSISANAIGEKLESSGSTLTYTSTGSTVAALSVILTAGVWKVTGSWGGYTASASTSMAVGINTSSAVIGTPGINYLQYNVNNTGAFVVPAPEQYITTTGTTAYLNISGGTGTAVTGAGYGLIRAVRIA